MVKYRFKTLDEFVKEFGDNWYNIVTFSWSREHMDDFLGKDLSVYMNEKQLELMNGTGTSSFNINSFHFMISTDMVVKKLLPSYKPKKIIRKI